MCQWAQGMCVCCLSLGAYNGTFHDAAQEKQVDVFGTRGGGHFTQIIQYLLHGWMDEAGDRDTYADIDRKRKRERDKNS